MAVAVGDLDRMLLALEASVRGRLAQVQFFFGEENVQRSVTPPYVIWDVVDGTHSEETRERAPIAQESYVDDLVEITARCVGQAPAGQVGGDLGRRRQLEASLQVFLAVSWAVHGQHQGYVEDRGWRRVPPLGPEDATCPIEYTFAIRAGRLEPAPDLTQPTSQSPTVALVVSNNA